MYERFFNMEDIDIDISKFSKLEIREYVKSLEKSKLDTLLSKVNLLLWSKCYCNNVEDFGQYVENLDYFGGGILIKPLITELDRLEYLQQFAAALERSNTKQSINKLNLDFVDKLERPTKDNITDSELILYYDDTRVDEQDWRYDLLAKHPEYINQFYLAACERMKASGRKLCDANWYDKTLLDDNDNFSEIKFITFEITRVEGHLEYMTQYNESRQATKTYLNFLKKKLEELQEQTNIKHIQQIIPDSDLPEVVLLWLQVNKYIKDLKAKPIQWLKNKQLLRELLTHPKIKCDLSIADMERLTPTMFVDKKGQSIKLAKNKVEPNEDSDKLRDFLATL